MIEDEVMLRIYGRALLKKTAEFPVVEALAGQRTLLSAEEVQKCSIDRDAEFEARLVPIVEELKDHPLSPLSPDVSEDEEEETAALIQKNVDADVEKTAEVQQPPSSVVNEAELSSGVS